MCGFFLGGETEQLQDWVGPKLPSAKMSHSPAQRYWLVFITDLEVGVCAMQPGNVWEVWNWFLWLYPERPYQPAEYSQVAKCKEMLDQIGKWPLAHARIWDRWNLFKGCICFMQKFQLYKVYLGLVAGCFLTIVAAIMESFIKCPLYYRYWFKYFPCIT